MTKLNPLQETVLANRLERQAKAKETMTNNEKELRTKVLDSMKKCKVKPPKFMFPKLSNEEYKKIPSTNGYYIIWTRNNMKYNFASISIEGVINQVLKIEKDGILNSYRFQSEDK